MLVSMSATLMRSDSEKKVTLGAAPKRQSNDMSLATSRTRVLSEQVAVSEVRHTLETYTANRGDPVRQRSEGSSRLRPCRAQR
jgi:hypothetical protein